MTAPGMWHPVALSSGIDAGTSNGTRLAGREIVVWRDDDGAAHVWEDRCPHRGMRLSFGFVRGDRIACLYHGWQYDADGRCRYIPAHPQLTPPETIRVPVIDSAERLGMVWVRERAETEPPADRPVTPVRSITVECAPATAADRIVAAPAATVHSPALFSIGDDGGEIIVGLQPLSADECTLHIVVAGTDDDAVARRKRVSAWAEDLRRALEAGP